MCRKQYKTNRRYYLKRKRDAPHQNVKTNKQHLYLKYKRHYNHKLRGKLIKINNNMKILLTYLNHKSMSLYVQIPI